MYYKIFFASFSISVNIWIYSEYKKQETYFLGKNVMSGTF